MPLLVARLVVGLLFLYMGTKKIADPFEFLKLMRQYKMLPAGYAMNLIAVVVPWVEAVCGAALLAGVALRGAGLISAGMLAVFTPLILIRGIELRSSVFSDLTFCQVSFDCGCGAGVVLLCNKLAENAGLLLLALVAVLSRSRRFCLSGALLQKASPNDR
ncbi:MAG: DoxX family protein [Planctomycetota bacterium]